MNRKLMALLPGLLLAGACTTLPPGTAAPAGCKRPPTQACSNAPHVTINLQAAGGPTVAPECINADRNGSVTIKLVPPPAAAGKVVTTPADSADGWLVGSNGTGGAPVGEIQIAVPADVVSGKQYKYTLQSDKGACLDPRIHIN
jgi:hypothetical protein